MAQLIQDVLMTTDVHPTEEQLVALLNGRISAEESTTLVAHLKTCSECMELFASLEAPVWFLGRAFHASQIPSLDRWECLSKEIHDALREAKRSKATRTLYYAPNQEAAWFAAADLAVALIRDSGTNVQVQLPTSESGHARLTMPAGCVVLSRKYNDEA